MKTYDSLVSGFAWNLPARYNIAAACADRWATETPERICLIEDRGERPAVTMTCGELVTASRRLAGAMAAHGIARGDRVAIILPQSFATVVAHLAVYRLGAIAVPLAMRFGPEALGYRLNASGARMAVLHRDGLETFGAVQPAPAGLQSVIVVDGGFDPNNGFLDYDLLIADTPPACGDAATGPDDPALIIFTSGTTGPPKGALHGHRVVLGHLPGIIFHHEDYPQPGDRIYTPSDWAWAGGLLNVLLPSLQLGVPVVFSGERFRAEEAYRLMARQRVRNAFLPATALRMLAAATDAETVRDLRLRTIASAGESLPAATYDWAREALGLTANEFYGQTECNMVLGSSAAAGVSRAGAIGKAVPGHQVALLGEDGRPVPPGVPGTIAVKAPDPVMFLNYWQDPAATAAKFSGDWLLTGDQAVMDDEGYVAFVGREDDIITSAGYRIGPGEVENCLLAHPAVKLAAVVGKPDPLRTEIVKAYVVLKDGFDAGETLAAEIQLFVRNRLSAHEYPREIGFVAEMPLTTSGKIIRREFRDSAASEAADATER
ncbi:AMP-dependent synthetase [Jiella endophytica]|uniref:AMP-dependent synthetase n=1 Tax=Jiella endophytica TaxID=2558362 RepID=A0A4Y8RPM5_9HYPH|nr:AMP-binding protein [Jiella endophytica]TFF25306.1 AMP-dependent synthetase [Jiella endophytica]